MTATKHFRMNLKYWRTRRAFSIRQLALDAKVSSTTIVKIENDINYIPRPDVINKLAKQLNVSVDDLLVDEPSIVGAA
jgi:transcriptional regulator with XRE-family HTH domain